MVELYDITILWNANTEIDLDFYKIKYATISGGPYTLAGTTKSTAFIHKDIPEGTTLYYIITAVDKSGLESAPSAEIVKTSPPDTTAPPPPTFLTARGLTDWTGVELFWNEGAVPNQTKGYLIYRSFDGVNYDIIATSTKPYYKDTSIPLHLDKYYGDTPVIYAVAAYDKYLNVSTTIGPTDIFSIPTLQNVKASIDYLSINITWAQPRPEDDVRRVLVYYKKKVDTAWTFAVAVDWPTSKARIDGPLLENTEYDVALKLSYSNTAYTIISATATQVVIVGDHTTEFQIGHPLSITGSGSQNGTWAITNSVFGGVNTIISATLPTSVAPLGTAGSENIGFQENWLRVIIPDYDADVTPPTAPSAVYARADPENKRAYVTWNRVAVDDDFLYYEVKVGTAIHGKTTDNNYTINNANNYKDGSDLLPIYISAVDRAGNKTAAPVYVLKWYDEIAESAAPNFPAWMISTMPAVNGRFRYLVNVEYDLVWNDSARGNPDFEAYFITYRTGAPSLGDTAKPALWAASPFDKTYFVKETANTNQLTINWNQHTWNTPPTATNSYYFRVGYKSKYGKYYHSSNPLSIVEVKAVDTSVAP